MAKQGKSNKESKKAKADSDGTKKQKKDPRRYDGTTSGPIGGSK
jgi:hypothetical protein